MKFAPEDGGQRLLRIAALASVLGAVFVANVSAYASAAGAALGLGLLIASIVVRRRRAKLGAG